MFVPDMAGSARGKVLPADKIGKGALKMPEAVFGQTISGDYATNKYNVEDRDMNLVADPSTLRPVPWAIEPAASVFVDCYHSDGTAVGASPRSVLRSVLGKYEARGWIPVVAPEVEFYLINPHSDPNEEAEAPEGRLGWTEGARQPYSIDAMNHFDPFINDLYAYCEAQDIHIDTLSQEMGPAQFEINFLHGNAVDLADQVFLFKRTLREVAIMHEMHATFLAKPMAEEAGSALHVHQSVVDKEGANIFSNKDGAPSELFYGYHGRFANLYARCAVVFRAIRKFLSAFHEPMGVAG